MEALNGDSLSSQTELTASQEQDAIIQHMDISIVESEKRYSGALALKEHYVVYLIETKVTDPKFTRAETVSSVWRRYSEFETLRNYLENVYQSCIIPPLPEKRPAFQRSTQNRVSKDALFIERRRVRLENFLLRLARHPVLSWDRVFLMFLQSDLQWNSEKQVLDENYVQLAENTLKSIALRLRKPDEYFENLRAYSTNSQSNIGQFLKVRANLADCVYGLHKLHANYGRVFSEWSALEKSMGDGLQKSGHYMDCFASAIDNNLEDEDLVADELKEYLHFAQSLQSVCWRHAAAQVAVEKAQQQLATHEQYKEKVSVPLSQRGNFLYRWASVPETEEMRQAKLETAGRNVAEAETHLHSVSDKLEKFSLQATNEVRKFEQQKESDLRESLAGFVLLQLQRSKMGLQTWKNIKQALEEIP